MILDSVDFDIAVNYDESWTIMDEDLLPGSMCTSDDIVSYMKEHGCVLSRRPFVWQFHSVLDLRELITLFVDGDTAFLAKIEDVNELPGLGVLRCDSEIVSFWTKSSQYIMTTLPDYVGVVFISSVKRNIEMLEKRLSSVGLVVGISKDF